MSFGEEDSRGKLSFSSCHVKGTYYQCGLSLWMVTLNSIPVCWVIREFLIPHVGEALTERPHITTKFIPSHWTHFYFRSPRKSDVTPFPRPSFFLYFKWWDRNFSMLSQRVCFLMVYSLTRRIFKKSWTTHRCVRFLLCSKVPAVVWRVGWMPMVCPATGWLILIPSIALSHQKWWAVVRANSICITS